jgi:hypothetical protein
VALKALEHDGQATRVLGTNPVQFEAIGYKQSQALMVIRELCGQGFDPGVELLLGQLAHELVHACLPKRMARVGLKFWGDSLGHVLLIFCGQMREKMAWK